MSRRALLVLACVFLSLRALLLLSSADRIGEPDAAETKLMEVGDRWIASGPPSAAELVRAARAGRNAPHGGFLPMSLAYAALAVPLRAAGSIWTLKVIAVIAAAVGFVAWTATAARLLGPGAAWLMALLLLFPPPALLGGQLVAWGSHAEVPWLLGLLAWAAASREGAVGRGEVALVGVLSGVAAGFDLLAAPLALALLIGWALDRGRSRIGPALLIAAAPLALSLWITGGLGASVTETAGNEPAALLGAAGLTSLLQTLGQLLPLPFVGPAQVGETAAAWINGGLTVGLAGAAVAAGLGEDRWRRRLWLVVAPVGFVILVAAAAPRRPAVAVRYLLPVWPLLLLGASAGAVALWARWRAARPVVVAFVAALALSGLVTAGSLVTPGRMGGAMAWDPARYTAADFGHVTYELAPGVATLLDRVGPRIVLPGPDAPDVRGLAAVLGAGSGDRLLLEGPHRFAPEAVAQRIDAIGPTLGPDERARFYEQVGWGLALVYPGQTASQLGILSRLGAAEREAAERGQVEAAGWLRVNEAR